MVSGRSKTQPDRRSHPGSALSVQVHAPSENFLLLSYATGLSQDGLFVRASRPLPEGTEVRLALHSHGDSEQVVTHGKVILVHDEPGQRGMEMAFKANGSRCAALDRLLDRLGD